MKKIKEILEKIKKNNFLKKGDKYFTIIFVIGLLIVINVISSQISFRGDLTAAGDYSISNVSKKTAGSFEDVVNIKAYFSKNLPAQYLNLQQEVMDILAEYANYSKGKIKVKIIDPTTLENAQKELGDKGIPTLQFNTVKNDEFQVVNGWLGIEIAYGGKTEVIPVVSDTQNLEYQITSALKKLASKSMPTVGIVTSNNTVKTADMAKTGETVFSQAAAKLGELYQIKSIDLSKDAITDDISTLLLVGPKEKFTDAELKKIDAFVMKGKSLIMLIDGINVAKGMGAEKNDLGLGKLLNGYGLKLNNDLVSDRENGRASFSSNSAQYTMTYMINYPLWPKILPNNMDKANVMVANLQSLIFPWVSSIEANLKDGENISYLAKSTNDARSQTENFVLDPQAQKNSTGRAGQYNLAVYVSGKLTSPFGQGNTDKARIILVGDSDFATDMFTGNGSDNMLFFQNIVDGLTLDNDLINIRAKSAAERPIKLLDKTSKEAVRYGNIFGVTVLVLVIGLARYFFRRRNKIKKTENKENSAANNSPIV
jgi:gliding-associated putative ABC transporter substrate-binding component GldG